MIATAASIISMPMRDMTNMADTIASNAPKKYEIADNSEQERLVNFARCSSAERCTWVHTRVTKSINDLLKIL